jgi:hypothetical protein
MAIHKEGDAKMNFGVTALVKESELNLWKKNFLLKLLPKKLIFYEGIKYD